MESKNLQYYDWVCKIIETCYHDFHFEAVDNLINLYYEKFKDEDKKVELEMLRTRKWNQIHTILE